MKSQLERDQWKALTRKLKRTKVRATYETKRIPYTVVIHRNYIPDFVLEFPDGHERIIEIKGYLRPEDRQKMRFVKQQHPDLDLRIVFAKDNKMNSKSKTLYSTWAKKLGIPYSIGSIPQGWLNRDG